MTLEGLHRIFTHIPTLETERLVLRRILPMDASDMYEYSKNPSVTKHLLWEEHPAEEYTQNYIGFLQERYDLGDFYDWALIHKDQKKMIGSCGFTSIDLPNNSAEIGYVLHHDFWGTGYMTEAVSEVLHFGFHRLGLSRISAVCMKENLASLRVMEKCGLRREGLLRQAVQAKGKQRDVFLAAITAEDYFAFNTAYI